MRQTLISIAVLTALSLPGLAGAEVGPFSTENRVGQPAGTAKSGGRSSLYGWHEDFVVKPRKAGPASPRDPASGLPTGKR